MIFVLALSFGAMCSAKSTDGTNDPPQRLRPPASLKCSRDHLTSFQGRIIDYKRGEKSIFLSVRTDEETTENFTLKWEDTENAEKWFLLRGEEFKAEDWKLIESAHGRLVDGMRIIVWVCDDGSKPVFDWRPKES
ncbi:MAG: hypothetical protein IPM55_11190 [Acidobacteria bacterium]|nr:hypothetical protein [Acidobacteriota bacterium]